MKAVNGITSWIESHHEIVSAIAIYQATHLELSGIIGERYSAEGTRGMYELGEELTDKFEALHEGRQWHAEYFDEIEKFLKSEIGI